VSTTLPAGASPSLWSTEAGAELSPLVSATPRAVPTAAGRWMVLAGATFLLVGVFAGRPAVSALGAVPVVALVWAWATARTALAELAAGGLAVRVGQQATQRAEPTGEHARRPSPGRRGAGAAEEELRVTLGRTLRLPVRLRSALRSRLRDVEISAAPTYPLAATLEGEGDERTLALTPRRVGDAWLQGFRVRAAVAGGLFEVNTWVPHPLRVSVLPRHFPLRSDAPLRATRASLQEQAGVIYTRRRGLGLEIRELRDHQSGDPFKHIAWRASARRGKLISREFESDLVLSTWVLVDVSPSMFWGTEGQTRIDYAIEVAYALLEVIVGRGDRAGLLVFDDQVRLQVNPGTGRHHLVRLVDALTEATQLVHEGRTEITDRELVERVARWFEVQQGLSFALPSRLMLHPDPRESGLDEARLIAAARDHLRAAIAARPRGRPQVPVEAYARDPNPAILRAFCRHAGVPLPMDPTPRPGGQALGLESAIHTILGSRGGPHAIVALSDFYTADDHETLRRVALAARRHRHSMVVFCPSDPAFEAGAPLGDRLEQALVEVARLRINQNLTAAQAVLRPAGVTFLRCGPEDVLPRLLLRLKQVA
jgi:uncharacterized protein (DUF58 family)